MKKPRTASKTYLIRTTEEVAEWHETQEQKKTIS